MERKEKMKEMNSLFFSVNYFNLFDQCWSTQFVLICFTSHCFFCTDLLIHVSKGLVFKSNFSYTDTAFRMIHDLGSRYNGDKNRSDMMSWNRLKSCCPHSLSNLCVQTDGAWWILKKCCIHWDVGNYPDGCIICLKSFSIEWIFPAKKSKDWMVCSICYDLVSSHCFKTFINSLICACMYIKLSFLLVSIWYRDVTSINFIL